MLNSSEGPGSKQLAPTIYTYDVEIDYLYGEIQTLYEEVIEDRSWFKLDRRPFEHKFPQSLPHFLYRMELLWTYTIEGIENAVKRGSRLEALSKLPGYVQLVDKSLLFRHIAAYLRSKKERLFKLVPVTFSFDAREVQFHRDI